MFLFLKKGNEGIFYLLRSGGLFRLFLRFPKIFSYAFYSCISSDILDSWFEGLNINPVTIIIIFELRSFYVHLRAQN